MPELPEVETVVRDIKRLIGRKVVFNRLLDDRNFKTPFYKLDGFVIENIMRYGKYIIIKFNKSALLIHLGMAGKLIIDTGDVLIPKYCNWLIQLDNGEQIRYIDHRYFGRVHHMTATECINYVQARLGPEPWEIDAESFVIRIKQKKYLNKPIKDVLLQQELIAGIGNIYASEICHEAYLHPKNLVKDLTDKQIENILYCSRRVLEKAIKNNGTTFRDYRNAKNQTGNNQNFLKAYKQIDCNRCNEKIIKEKIKGRMTYWCNSCQRLLGGDLDG